MTRRRTAVALALLLLLSACGSTATLTASPTTPSPSPVPTPPVAQPTQQPRSAAATPATILALAEGTQPSGPWAVTFQRTGFAAVREVYVLTPACEQATCDINASIQTFAGDPIGTGTFRHVDGMYRFEADGRDVGDCNAGGETIPAGATRISHTTLLIAGYRPAGTAVVSVAIRGSRTVQLTPVGGNGCSAETLEYLASGEETQFAAVPTPTPKPAAASKVPVITGSFFDPRATVVTYQVAGSTESQIIRSIQARGPFSDWVHTRAEALTRAVPKSRFELSKSGGQCHVVVTAKPAVIFTFVITLPKWSPPAGVDRATILWWIAEQQRVATHERHHVEIYRAGAARMTTAVAGSTCSNVSGRLAAIVKDVNKQQCEFDLKEYGTALGLSLASCLTQ